jgi:putative hydrolase of the HAD superfamily
MAPMIRQWPVLRQWGLLLVIASGLLVGCSSERDRQWYKPAANYTTEEFKRDRDNCTSKKDNVLDEACMKQKGWVPLTSDRPANTPKPEPSVRGPATSPRAVVFDFGGVLWDMRWDVARELDRAHGLPRSSVFETLYRCPAWADIECGVGDPTAWTDGAHRELERRAGRALPRLHDEWRKAQVLIERNVALVRALRPPYRCSVLSNADVSLRARLEGELALQHLFDDIVVSAEVGMAKPTPAIFQLAADRLGLPPAACVFVDDWDRNVEAARALGMTAVLHRADKGDDLRAQLAAVGVSAA